MTIVAFRYADWDRMVPQKTKGEHKVAHKYEYKPNFVKMIVSRHLALIGDNNITV